MTYPMSAAVVAGQATEADQYNFLRNDALCLGGDPASSGTLRDLLYQGMTGVRLTRASKTSIRLEASADAPCAVVINGKICTVTEELTLSLSIDAFSSSGRYYLYAISNSGPAFTLRAALSTAPSNSRQIGTFLWSGSGIIPGSLYAINAWDQQQGASNPSVCEGRLTLVPGEPVPDADIRLGDTLYFTPFHGNAVSLYLGDAWETFRFSELSLPLSGMLREVPYDVFLTADENGLRLSMLTWGTASARPAGMLARVDGVRVSGGNSGARYLGTIALNASGYGEDSCTGRLLWNEYHRLPRSLISKLETTRTQGSAHMNSWAPYYDEDAPEVRVLIPAADCEFALEGVGLGSPISENDREYGRGAALGICRDMMKSAPYTGNRNCAEVFAHTNGNSPMSVRIQNLGSSFQGFHRYTLAFWSNYSYYPIGTSQTAAGEAPGLIGMIYA